MKWLAAAVLAASAACSDAAEENEVIDLPQPSGPPIVQQAAPELGPEVEAAPARTGNESRPSAPKAR